MNSRNESVILESGGRKPMPKEMDQNLDPEENPEEKEYSFLQETIKSKPLSRRQAAGRAVRFAVCGALFGACACLGFFALKPLVQNLFPGKVNTVSIPEDDLPDEEQSEEDTKKTEDTEADAGSYEQMMSSMAECVKEAQKGLVSVSPIREDDNWNSRMTGISGGTTGVIIADNGRELLILADNSVCEDAEKWNVVFADSSSCTAELKKRDINDSLAVFSIPRNNISDSAWNSIKVSALGNSHFVKQGDVVIALGDMQGYADGLGYGIVSSVSYKTSFYDRECSVISTDIPIADQGKGVLFNMDGEVIGLISDSVWPEQGSSAVNAYAISDLKTVIEILANGESVPYIGIRGTTVTRTLQEEQGMPSGVYVVDVQPDSPAMKAGIQTGDIICRLNKQELAGLPAYQNAVLQIKSGTTVRLTGQRRGNDGYVEVEFNVTVGSNE